MGRVFPLLSSNSRLAVMTHEHKELEDGHVELEAAALEDGHVELEAAAESDSG